VDAGRPSAGSIAVVPIRAALAPQRAQEACTDMTHMIGAVGARRAPGAGQCSRCDGETQRVARAPRPAHVRALKLKLLFQFHLAVGSSTAITARAAPGNHGDLARR